MSQGKQIRPQFSLAEVSPRCFHQKQFSGPGEIDSSLPTIFRPDKQEEPALKVLAVDFAKDVPADLGAHSGHGVSI